MRKTTKPNRRDHETKSQDTHDIQAALDKLSPQLRQAVVRWTEIRRGIGYHKLGPRGKKMWVEILPTLGWFGFRPERPTARVEANALIAYCVRNGPWENLHANGKPLGQTRMRELMIFSSRQLEGCLEVRSLLLPEEPSLWWTFINGYHAMYCGRWPQR